MAERSTLTVQAVLDRFDESGTTLTQLAEKLRALTLAEEATGEAASSIASAAANLDSFVAALQKLTEQATAAQAEVRKAVESASQFLGATDLAALRRSIQDLTKTAATQLEHSTTASESTQAILEWQQKLEESVEARFDVLERKLAGLEQCQAEAASLRQKLDKVRAGLSDRKLQQLGIG
jgi:chromosome segregation ATPase